MRDKSEGRDERSYDSSVGNRAISPHELTGPMGHQDIQPGGKRRQVIQVCRSTGLMPRRWPDWTDACIRIVLEEVILRLK